MVRIVTVFLGTCYLLLVIWQVAAYRLLLNPSPDNLLRGTRWFPNHAAFWSLYGHQLLMRPDGPEPQRAASAFLEAARRNPYDTSTWEALAQAYLQMGDTAKAEAAYKAELLVAPHSPKAAWRYANYLLLRERSAEAIPLLRTATATDASLRTAAFEAGWKILDDAGRVLREVVPQDTASRIDYVWFLTSRKKSVDAVEAWEAVRPVRDDPARHAGYGLIDHLIVAGLPLEADRVWKGLLADLGKAWLRPETELLTNGDFEDPLPLGGLQWRFEPGAGYQIEIDSLGQSGSRSCRVSFDRTANPDFYHVHQFVPVRPQTRYRFQGFMKTENITSDSGVRFAIFAAGGGAPSHLLSEGPARPASQSWTPDQMEFRTGPDTRFVMVSLRRQQSPGLINSAIGGRVWIDNLSLRER